MSEVTDLNVLFDSPKESVKFVSKDGQEFILKIEINAEMTLKSIKLFKEGKEEIECASQMLSDMIKEQLNKDLKPEWILKNINYKFLLYINKKLENEISDALSIIKGGKSDSKKK